MTKLTADQLQAVLGRDIASVAARNWDYHTSHAMQLLHVVFPDGSSTEMIFKDLAAESQLHEAKRARPNFLYNPGREIDVYRDLLSTANSLGAPAFYAADAERQWLFIENVRGIPLWQCELDLWSPAARWLKQLHSHRFGNLPASLLRHDAAYFARWIERAAEFRPELRRIAKKYGRVIDRLTALPATFIHGEFYPSNILVEDGRRIRPVDWETAAVGPGLIDLAALCGGRFDDARREQLAQEYGAAIEDLEFCRLHLAIQWLGWSSDWKPPEEHAHDWLAEVMSLAWKLGVA